MIAVALIGGVVVPAILAASCLRLPGICSTLLAAYLVLVCEVTAITALLSPFHAVTRAGLAVAEAVLLIVAGSLWALNGRPVPSFAPARAVARELVRDPVTVTFAAAVAVALSYELMLDLTVPPNNWDSLTYHLARVAAWVQHHGIYWIPHAPTDRMNEFQPLAEQQILFLFVATGKGALFALPQFIAQLAILTAIFTSARRLGYEARLAACAALFYPTLTLAALEATTSQNDLVAAALVCAAAALLLGRTRAEVALAGVAVALGLGVKLTTALALPILAGLLLLRGRRAFGLFAASAAIGFTMLAMWGFVRNAIATGHLLGHGGGRVEESAHPAVRGLLVTGYRVLYRLLDLSGFGPWTLAASTFVALCVLCGGVLLALGRDPEGRRAGLLDIPLAVVPLLAPILVIVVALGAHRVGQGVGLSIRDPAFTFAPFRWHVNTRSNEDISGFGAIGGLVVIGIPLFALWEGIRRRADPRMLVLATSLPVFVLLLALTAKYNPWLSRFLLVPVALAAPLSGRLFRKRLIGFALAGAAALAVTLALVRNDLKPLDAGVAPWTLSQAQAVELGFMPQAGKAAAQLERRVPADAHIGALLGPDDPSYLLYGPRLARKVTYLGSPGAVGAADRAALRFVVISPLGHRDAIEEMRRRGWTLEPLSTHWILAIRDS